MMARVREIGIGAARLSVRRSVAARERTLADGAMAYLSLLDDEIDARCAAFSDRAGRTCAQAAGAASHLELTDAVILAARDGRVSVLRGAACTFALFWRADRAALRLATSLPLHDGAAFSKGGLIAAAAAARLHGSYEPNGFLETPLAAWRRVRRAAVSVFEHGACVSETPIRGDPAPAATHDDVIAQLRAAFAAYRHSQAQTTCSVLELSGGFDSTLAATAAQRQGHVMHGVSVEFPYYEFRHELAVQRATGEAIGVPRTVFDGRTMFPYAPWEDPPRFDEPAVFVTGVRHAERVGRFAQEKGARRIYMGHGGDQVFATDLTRHESVVSDAMTRGPFSSEAWAHARGAIRKTSAPLWRDRALGVFTYDARQDVWIKETFGATIRTPFTDLAVFRAGQAWSRFCRAGGVRPDKAILADALGELLPAAVVGRKGKTAYDGVWMRAYAAHGDDIMAVFARAGAMLAHLGVSEKWLARRVRDLAAWRPVSDREVLGLYGLAAWLLAWGLERPGDVGWA